MKIFYLTCLALFATNAHNHGDDNREGRVSFDSDDLMDDLEDYDDDRYDQLLDACEEVQDLCEDEIEADNFVAIFSCAAKSKLSSECREVAQTNYPALFMCSEELERSCTIVGLEDDSGPWNTENHVRDAGIRCIDEVRTNFSEPCSSAILAEWLMLSPRLGLSEQETLQGPMSQDIYRMFSQPESHGKKWIIYGHGFVSALLMVCAVMLCRRFCCKRGCCKSGCSKSGCRRRGGALIDQDNIHSDVPMAVPIHYESNDAGVYSLA